MVKALEKLQKLLAKLGGKVGANQLENIGANAAVNTTNSSASTNKPTTPLTNPPNKFVPAQPYQSYMNNSYVQKQFQEKLQQKINTSPTPQSKKVLDARESKVDTSKKEIVQQ